MKKTTLLFFILILFSCKNENETKNSSEKTNPDWEFYELKGKVKSAIEFTAQMNADGTIGNRKYENQFQLDNAYYFDENGLLTNQKKYLENNSIAEDIYFEGKDKIVTHKKFSSPTEFLETKYTWEGKNNTIITKRLNGNTILDKEVFRYDPNNNLIEKITFNNNDLQTSKTTYTYNNEQKLIEESYFGSELAPISKIVYEYDKNDDRVTEAQYDKEMKLNYKTSNEYKNHELISTKTYNNKYELDYEKRKTFGNQNNLIAQNIYEAFDNSNKKEIFTYDTKGNMLTWKITVNSKTEREISYSYNEKNDLISEIHKDKIGKIIYSKECIIKYDNQDNWIEKKIKTNSGEYLVTRKIEYY